mmetsp:Transcript_1036/g.1329  ORF Transcript_1036/g.1329 Transcript_1036/m.1329 type:complete len:537 (+) Transcript_1036:639-2249(+)
MHHLAFVVKAYRKKKGKQQDGKISTESFSSAKADVDEVFPQWLTKRGDFQLMFPRFANDIKDWEALMMVALRKLPDQRAQDELELIANWLRQVPASQIQGINRASEMARYIQYSEFNPGQRIYSKGDPSELFFIVYSGEVELLVEPSSSSAASRRSSFNSPPLTPLSHISSGSQLRLNSIESGSRTGAKPPGMYRTLGPGEAFGHEALGKPQARFTDAWAKNIDITTDISQNQAYTIVLLHLSNFHYQLMVLQERNGAITGVIQKLRTCWPMGTNWTNAKLYHLAASGELKKYESQSLVFDQDEESDECYILLNGKCAVKKIVEGSRENRWPDGRSSHGHFLKKFEFPVRMRTLVPGDVFGEDTSLLGFTCRQYRVVSLTHATEVIQIKKQTVQEMFSPVEKEEIKNLSCELYQPKEQIFEYYCERSKERKSLEELKESALGSLYKRRTSSFGKQPKGRSRHLTSSYLDGSDVDLLSCCSMNSLNSFSTAGYSLGSTKSLPGTRSGSLVRSPKRNAQHRDTISLPFLNTASHFQKM